MDEERRLDEPASTGWKLWGPYLSERQWGTVREDYSPGGTAWDSFSHDAARSRAYRWGEDGILGHQRRPADPLFRARAVERTRPDPEGTVVRPDQQRGQPRRRRQGVLLLPRRDADALVSARRSTSIRSGSFRTRELVDENRRRGKDDPEFELVDTGVFDEQPLLRCRHGIREAARRRTS